MDNLTHSLIGAALGQTGLKWLSGLGMPTLIIAANIPDVDAACAVYGTASLSMRRGLTHGPIAMAVLPILLTGAMIAFDRWQARRGTRPQGRAAVRFWPLLLLAVIGTLSHPAFDWLNSYGIRLLEPFSSQWFYGDALFIIDPWIWVLLIGGWFWSRRAEKTAGNWSGRGRVIAGLLAIYVAGNIAISAHASLLGRSDAPYPAVAVANPVPFAFWRRDVLWRTVDDRYGQFDYSLFEGIRRDDVRGAPTKISPRVASDASKSADARAFLFWSRMPVARYDGNTLILSDQRFDNPLVRDRFAVRIER